MTPLRRSREDSVSRLAAYGRVAVFIFATVCVCPAAQAQYAALEWTTADADIIYVGRVESAGKGRTGFVLRPVPGVAAIRGTPPAEFEPQGWWAAHLNVVGSEWLVFLKYFTKDVYGGDPPPQVPEVDRSEPYVVPLDGSATEFTLRMQPVTARESLLSLVRDAARTIPPHPAHLDLMDPPIGQIGGGMSAPSMRLPVCPVLERAAHALLDHPRDSADLIAGLTMLAPFKSAENLARARALLSHPEVSPAGNLSRDWPNRLDRVWTSPYPVRQQAASLLRDTWGVALPAHVETEAGDELYRPFPAFAVLVPAIILMLAFAIAPLLGRRRRRWVLLGVWSLLSILILVAWLRTRGGGVDRFVYPTRWGELEVAVNPGGQIRLLHVRDHPELFGMLHYRLSQSLYPPDDLWLAQPSSLISPASVRRRYGFTTSRGTVRASETSEYAFHLWAIPLWPVLSLCLAYPLLRGAVAARAIWVHWRRRPPGVCRSCGYNLTGNRSGTCPECGRPTLEGAKGCE